MTEVVQITVGGGSPEGSNSAYLLPAHATVVDPGPPGNASYDRLRTGITDAGLELTDVEHVVVTHWHTDHGGLAPRLAAAADAAVHIHERDAPLLAEYAVARRRRMDRDAVRLAAWGVPSDRVDEVHRLDTPSQLPDTTPVEPHEGGDVVAGGELVHTPGHTAGHLAVRVEDAMFVGDAVLPTYTPNVGGSDTRMTDPLPAYVRSLRTVTQHSGEFYPGHGSAVTVPERVEVILAHHRDRARRTVEQLAAREEATPWTIATDLFGELRGIHVKFGAGEAAAHLGALTDTPYVERIATEPHRYVLVERPDEDAALLPSLE